MTEAAPHIDTKTERSPGRTAGRAERSRPEEEEPERADANAPGPGLPPPTAIESLVNALIEAGPEAAEHVVAAAQELLLAAQSVIDAFEHAVQEQQELRRTAKDATSPPAATRHLDLAE